MMSPQKQALRWLAAFALAFGLSQAMAADDAGASGIESVDDRLASAPSAAPAAPANPVICKRVVELGSHIRKRVCRSKAEWQGKANPFGEGLRSGIDTEYHDIERERIDNPYF